MRQKSGLRLQRPTIGGMPFSIRAVYVIEMPAAIPGSFCLSIVSPAKPQPPTGTCDQGATRLGLCATVKSVRDSDLKTSTSSPPSESWCIDNTVLLHISAWTLFALFSDGMRGEAIHSDGMRLFIHSGLILRCSCNRV